MKDDETEIELIEQYHKGLLSKEKLNEFFEREKSDKDFSAKVKSYKEIMEGINYHGKQKSISDSIQLWEKEIKEQAGKAKQNEARIIPLHRKNLLFSSGLCCWTIDHKYNLFISLYTSRYTCIV